MGPAASGHAISTAIARGLAQNIGTAGAARLCFQAEPAQAIALFCLSQVLYQNI
jgi:uncharacterized protein involved in propanediol utilization